VATFSAFGFGIHNACKIINLVYGHMSFIPILSDSLEHRRAISDNSLHCLIVGEIGFPMNRFHTVAIHPVTVQNPSYFPGDARPNL
jgi:hypothetical protein